MFRCDSCHQRCNVLTRYMQIRYNFKSNGMFETRTVTIVEVHNSKHECNARKVNLCGQKITIASEHSAVVASGQCTMPPCESEIFFSYTTIMTKLRGEVLVVRT